MVDIYEVPHTGQQDAISEPNLFSINHSHSLWKGQPVQKHSTFVRFMVVWTNAQSYPIIQFLGYFGVRQLFFLVPESKLFILLLSWAIKILQDGYLCSHQRQTLPYLPGRVFLKNRWLLYYIFWGNCSLNDFKYSGNACLHTVRKTTIRYYFISVSHLPSAIQMTFFKCSLWKREKQHEI